MRRQFHSVFVSNEDGVSFTNAVTLVCCSAG
jgi:hypothetical protein